MSKRSSILVAFLLVVLFTVFNSTAVSQEKVKSAPIKGFPEASLTIFPVTYVITGPIEKHRKFYDGMMGPAGQKIFDVTDTLGLLLEEKGYDNFKITDTAFKFPEGKARRDGRAAAFGAFVSKQDLKTDFALCTEFVCHLEKSFEEIYIVVVDAKGNVVWENSQGQGDPEFDNDFPGSPKKCCALVVKRLTPVMGLDNLPKKELSAEKKEALQKMRAEEPPSQAEFEAMEKRLETMKNAGASAQLIIYPTRVGGDHTDQASSKRLAGMISDAGLCKATVAETGPVLKGEGWPNEQRVLWLFAHAAQEHIKQNPVDSGYVLFADFWQRPNDKGVHAVHFVLCDQSGNLVIADLQNSHQEDFQNIKPTTLEDCDRLVVERIKKLLR
jgi:hypothetical protein